MYRSVEPRSEPFELRGVKDYLEKRKCDYDKFRAKPFQVRWLLCCLDDVWAFPTGSVAIVILPSIPLIYQKMKCLRSVCSFSLAQSSRWFWDI